MAYTNGTDKAVADDAESLARDVQRGASRVLVATAKGARRISREVKPTVRGNLKDALRGRDPENALADLVREYPWTSLAVVAVGSALLVRTLFRLS